MVFCFHDAMLERLTVPGKCNAKFLEKKGVYVDGQELWLILTLGSW